MNTAVGFIGLGRMGLPMAQYLLDADFSLSVFNRTASRADVLLQRGARWATSPRALAEQCDIVVSMITDDAALRTIALGQQGILAGLKQNGIHVDMSTVSPDVTQELVPLYQERETHFIASPVFGRPEAAAAAKLWICPAGPTAIVDRCRPLFDAMGQGVIVVGEEAHLANVLKLVGNFFVIAAIETLGEAFTLAEKGGLKDVGLMQKLAKDVVPPLPLADLAGNHLRAAFARGRGDLDWGALATVIREMAGLPSGVEEPQ
jgi:3-hydroxyisobutyrate dehydrogenase-like beta-hydroxyacid dehydrogenase